MSIGLSSSPFLWLEEEWGVAESFWDALQPPSLLQDGCSSSNGTEGDAVEKDVTGRDALGLEVVPFLYFMPHDC